MTIIKLRETSVSTVPTKANDKNKGKVENKRSLG